MVDFEWDHAKDQSNRAKHGLSFTEASELFRSADYLELVDEVHSDDEDRFLAIGPIVRGVIIVVFTEPCAETVRIISARPATKQETALYRKYMEGWK